MNSVADNPVIAPDYGLEEEQNPARRNHRASAARSAAGRPARKTNGSALAAMNGIPSTPEGSVRLAFISGLKRSAYRAVDGRRVRSGMRSKLFGETV